MNVLSCDLWAIEPEALSALRSMATSVLVGTTETVRAGASATSKQAKIGIIPVTGPLEARPTEMGAWLGMTSYEWIGNAVDLMMADETVGSIVFDVFSPGGMVYGAPELAAKIYSYRGRKPMISVANHMAASGAYWIAAAADRLVVSPSGDVGSVGVIAEHWDESKKLEDEGSKVTLIRSSASPNKAELNGVEPLTDEIRQFMQGRADRIYDQFSGDLARFRGVSVDYVNEKFGKGRIVDAQTAVRVGMADRVGTLQETVMKLAAGRIRIAGERAEDVWDGMTIQEERRQKLERIWETLDSPDPERNEEVA